MGHNPYCIAKLHNKMRAGLSFYTITKAVVATFGASLMLAIVPPALAASISTGVPYQLLPLGDSITAGFNDGDPSGASGGYRLPLQQLLTTGGYLMDFVGPRVDYSGSMPDPEHAGYSGRRIDEIDALLGTVMGNVPDGNPDLILLMIGTNDLFNNFDILNAPARLNTLIGNIYSREPGAYLLVSTILPIDSAATPDLSADWVARVNAFNASIPYIVSNYAATGRNIALVDIHAALTTADLYDGVHPTTAGYGKTATAWYAGIESVTQPVPLPSSLAMMAGASSFLPRG
mgnify:CR=1 FL=1